MKASKKEYLKHVLSHLKMAYEFGASEIISDYSLELDKIIDEQIKFNEYE